MADQLLPKLQQEYEPLRQGYESANSRVKDLTSKRAALYGTVKPQTIVPRNDFEAPHQISETPGGISALGALNSQLGQATQERDAYGPKLQDMAGKFRNYTDQTRANTLLHGVGAPATAVNTATTIAAGTQAGAPAGAAGAVATPGVHFIDPSNPASMTIQPPAPVTIQPPAPVKPVLRPGDPNTFTFSNGKTQAVPTDAAQAAPGTTPYLRTPSPVVATASNAPAVQDATQRTVQQQRSIALDTRADAARLLNPMGNEAELLRRAEIAASTMRGSPSSRSAVVGALLGQIGAGNAASAAGQQAANSALVEGAQGEGFANEAAARRNQDAQQFNVDAGQKAEELAAERARPTQTIRDSNTGTTSVLRNDGALTPLLGQDGKPIATPALASAGEITPKDLLESYNTQAKAVSEGIGTPVDKQQQMEALRQDPTYAPIFGQPQRVGDSPYPEGARLVKDGKKYVVKDGQPVEEQ